MELGSKRVWSWAPSPAEAQARRTEANALVGERIQAVRYFNIDYRRFELQPELVDQGPREIDAEDEWDAPTWRFAGFDTLDYGLEIATTSGLVFSLTWDPPGDHEGIGLQPTPMIGSGVRPDAYVAVWDLSCARGSWTHIIGTRVTRVDLHYLPWDKAGGPLWCPRITICCERGSVDVVMGTARDGQLVPSADDVAVLHPGQPLPPWFS